MNVRTASPTAPLFDSTESLLNNIRMGESRILDFADVRFAGASIEAPHCDWLADAFSAFANSLGGVFVLGVDRNSRDVTGIPIECLDTVAELVCAACTESVDPPITDIVVERIRLGASTDNELPVVKVEIPPSLYVHRSPGGYLYRTENARRAMSLDYLSRLTEQRSQARVIRFDEQPISGATVDDLVPDLWQRFLTPRSDGDRNIFLRKLRMARADENGTLRPTVTGVLMASIDPRQWIPNAYIQAVAYKGTAIGTPDSNYLNPLDAADIAGPLDVQVAETCRFVARNMKTAAFKDQGRGGRPQYDMTAVFEAVVNAVAHRDYLIHGSKIRLRMFENRLELYSPGSIANSMEVESLPHLQSARNEFISSLLAKCPVPGDVPRLTTDRRTMMDRRGEGVPLILDNSRRLSEREPDYRLIGDAELMLTIHAAGA